MTGAAVVHEPALQRLLSQLWPHPAGVRYDHPPSNEAIALLDREHAAKLRAVPQSLSGRQLTVLVADAGACEALGFRFLDAQGAPLPPGADLVALHRIDDSEVPPAVWRMGRGLRLACDVETPLGGPEGAARIFAPQKGASPEAVVRLEQSLERLGAVLQRWPGPCGPA